MMVRAEFVPIESRTLVTVDCDHDGSINAIITDYDLADAIVRVRFTITADDLRHTDIPGMRRELLAAGAHEVRIEPQIIRADRARVAGLDDSMSELDALDEWARVNGVDELLAGLMREKTRDYLAVVS